MLYDMTVCAACGKKGAHSRCMRCLQAAYCDKSCQKVHWRAGHKRECTNADTGITDAAAHQSPGSHSPAPTMPTAAAATPTHTTEAAAGDRPGADTSSSTAVNDRIAHAGNGDHHDSVHDCPICLDNPDTFSGNGSDELFAQCGQCGQLFCGPCKKQLQGGGECPTCRTSLDVSEKEQVRQLHNLVHTRSPGRHTPVAQHSLGVMYEDGTGVAKDFREAARLYALAAAHGHADSQYNLGIMYDNGTGVAQDYTEAARLWSLAAAQGLAKAQYSLGAMYHNGRGVAQDYREAARLFTLAAIQGHVKAQFHIGLMYTPWSQGGLVSDLAAAATWLRLAAAQGHARAQSALADFATYPIGHPGMRVQVFGLTSANGQAVNGREGLVQNRATKAGRAAVLLDGETHPTSISTTNLRRAGGL